MSTSLKSNARKTVAAAALGLAAISFALPAQAQIAGRLDATQIEPKPRVFSYHSNWTIPMSANAEMEQRQGAVEQILREAQQRGEILNYVVGKYFLHAQNITHRTSWTARTAADCIDIEKRLVDAGLMSGGALDKATGYHPKLFMSSYYNWEPGPTQDGYTYEAIMYFKEPFHITGYDQANKSFIVGMMENLMKQGAVQGYQISLEVYAHTEDMGYMHVSLYAKDASIIDKFVAEFDDLAIHNPAINPAWYNQMERMPHYDFLARSNYSLGSNK